MIKPQTISEQLLFTTIRLQTEQGVGTGFIFNFQSEDGKIIPVIITNKHVINNTEKKNVKIFLHVKDNNLPSGNSVEINYDTNWVFHSNKNIDLCCTVFAPLLNQIKEKLLKDIFYTSVSENLIWTNIKLEELNAVEDVLMIGYPTGLFDKKNNLPLIRKGITSLHPALEYNGDAIGVIDMSCFPGSSGSPIFIVNDSSYFDKNGSMILGRKRIVFLGVLFGAPTYTAEGSIGIKEIPTQQKFISINQTMINLGYYVKAREILSLKNEVFKKFNL